MVGNYGRVAGMKLANPTAAIINHLWKVEISLSKNTSDGNKLGKILEQAVSK